MLIVPGSWPALPFVAPMARGAGATILCRETRADRRGTDTEREASMSKQHIIHFTGPINSSTCGY
ncbi:hypothetical protein ABTH30_24505, partial [Acinetobacter baumannii]